jgi:uncharacterized membrane protein HdeD (DUF308 family)
MNKIKNFVVRNYTKVVGVVLGLGGVALAGSAFAQQYSTTVIASDFSTSLSGIVDAIVGVIITFFTNNLPVIVVLAVAISMVFYFVNKARRAGKGR